MSTDDEEKAPVAIDVYGVKLPATPGDLGEPYPASWRDVLRQMNGHLRRLTAGTTRLVAEMVESTTRLLRGASRLPTAVAVKLEESHERADVLEENRQLIAQGRGAVTPRSQRVLSDQSLDQIDATLRTIRARGIPASIVIRPSGQIVIVMGVAGKPEELVRALDEGKVDLEPENDPEGA